MLIVFNARDIQGRLGERALAAAVYYRQQFELLRATLTLGYGQLDVDETILANQELAADVANTVPLRDFQGLSKYYIRMPGQTLWQRGSWQPRDQGPYAPTTDQQMVLARSQEWAQFEDNLTVALNRLAEIENGLVLPTQAIRDLAQILRRTIRLQFRHLRSER